MPGLFSCCTSHSTSNTDLANTQMSDTARRTSQQPSSRPTSSSSAPERLRRQYVLSSPKSHGQVSGARSDITANIRSFTPAPAVTMLAELSGRTGIGLKSTKALSSINQAAAMPTPKNLRKAGNDFEALRDDVHSTVKAAPGFKHVKKHIDNDRMGRNMMKLATMPNPFFAKKRGS